MVKSKFTPVILITIFVVASFALSTELLAHAAPTANDWPMFHHDLTHTGYSTSTASATSATLLWNYTTNSVVGASPTIVNGYVYIGSDGGIAYCLNALDGSKVWNYTIQASTRGSHGAGGPAISSSMAVADGYVYFGCYDRNVYCLNAFTGDKIWNYTTGNTVESCPSVTGGYVYVGSWDGNMYCLDATTGEKIWNYTTGSLVESSPAVVDGKVYFGSVDKNVYCLDASNGDKIWSYPTGNLIQSSPAVVGDYLYIGSEDNNLYCLNASSGDKIWSYPTQGWVDSSPAVANGYVYVGSWVVDANQNDVASDAASDVYCLDASTGAKIWNYTTHGGVNSSPAVTGGFVYVGGWDNNVYCLNASTGAEIWTYTTQGHINSSPAVAGGIVYVGSWDHNVYAFGAPQPSQAIPTEIIYPAVAIIAVLVVIAMVLIFRKRKP